MYCPNCHVYNDEKETVCFACGTPLVQEEQPKNDFEQKPVLNINKDYSSTTPIVSVVLSFFVFNIIGIILSVLSLSKYNKYEQALFAGDIQKAQMLAKSSKKLAKAAIVITVLIMIIRPILLVSFLLVGADTIGLVGDGSLMASQGSASAAMLRT
ncbi:MAG: hypothetical protein ACI4W6_05185, partial [Acutalibacteraceae bacterium]